MPLTARRRWEALLALVLVIQLAGAGAAAVVLSRRGCTVDNHGSNRALAAQVKSACEAAIPRVTAVWGTDWSRHVVVVLPRTAQELARELPGEPDLQEVAAAVDRDQRVIVNPVAFARLSPTGRDVVLTHELTHVATGPARVPTWLEEGFADYVGFLDRDIPVLRVAPELAAQVAAGRVPRRLPPDDAFTGTALPAVYQQSWLAVGLLAHLLGQARLVELYRAVRGGTPLESALQREGLSTADLTARWRRDLLRQLR